MLRNPEKIGNLHVLPIRRPPRMLNGVARRSLSLGVRGMGGAVPERLPAPAAGSGPGSLRRIVHNSTMSLMAAGLNTGFNLLAVFALARRFDQAVFGRYYTMYALIMLVQLLTEAGLT